MANEACGSLSTCKAVVRLEVVLWSLLADHDTVAVRRRKQVPAAGSAATGITHHSNCGLVPAARLPICWGSTHLSIATRQPASQGGFSTCCNSALHESCTSPKQSHFPAERTFAVWRAVCGPTMLYNAVRCREHVSPGLATRKAAKLLRAHSPGHIRVIAAGCVSCAG